MIENIIEAFPLLQTRCTGSNDDYYFFINDTGDSPTEIIEAPVSPEEEIIYVKVINNTGNLIHHISVDNCLTRDLQQKSCDSVLLSDTKMVFLELKMNITTVRLKNADDTREGALFQIARSIELFSSELKRINKSIDDIEVVAHVAMPPLSPRSDATYKLIKDAFAEKYGYDFIDSREVEFS